MKTARKCHETSFRPRARLLQLLGDQLIRDPRIGVFELVKNAYDADSQYAEVIFHNVEKPDASIEIVDKGEGMDIDTVLNVWLEPGSDYRAKQRTEGRRTPHFRRLPIGEKGIGRFAVHKLGRRISMVTRKKGNNEILVEIDWDKLTTKHHYLTDAPVAVIEREPEVFDNNSSGTWIRITKLNLCPWPRGDIRRLYRAITAISSPHDEHPDFAVNFKMVPDPGWTDDLLKPEDVMAQGMFLFDFSIEGSRFDFRYEFKPIPGLQADCKLEPRILEKKDQLIEFFNTFTVDNGRRKKRPHPINLFDMGIGPIRGRFRGFDLDKRIAHYYLAGQKSLSAYLKSNGGVRVYRDGIRVYDYGEEGTDWLGLDKRYIQERSKRISNNLIIGEANIELENSPALIEKTNREGFVENRAFEEFRNVVLSAITRFEQERAKDKENIYRTIKNKSDGGKQKTPRIEGPEEAISALKERTQEAGLEKQIGEQVNKVESTYVDMRKILLDAVGSGLGLGTVFHEIERGVRQLNYAIERHESDERVKTLSGGLVTLLEGSSYFIKKSSGEGYKASKIAEYALFSTSPRFVYHEVQLSNAFKNMPQADFKFNGSRQMLTATVVNLFDNAIYWLNAKRGIPNEKAGETAKKIWIGPSHKLEAPAIVVADNGPGFEDLPEEMVRPFFTRKMEGMGLGLYFADLAMRSHGGRLAFPSKEDMDIPPAYSGAVVAMVFGRK